MSRREVERKLAAILAADVVGYSRLMGADEAGTVATMKALRLDLWNPLTERHRGRVVGTAGDSLLVEFVSAVAAVECAVAVQLAMAERNARTPAERQMQVRVGVNIGEVIVDGDDILGDGVNIAARLEALCAPGGVAISGNVHEQIQGKLDARFEDAGEHEVKNIARPIRVWRWSMSAGQAPASAPAAAEPLALPDKASIAVLPFDNMSDDAGQDYFSDGITEDIITALSKYRWFFVSARNSTFTYKGQAIDIKQVGRELGVRYVLEGSVRKLGNRVRITAQLVEAESGNHIWAERYDRKLVDIFDLQDEIQQAIVVAVEPEMAGAEYQRAARKTPQNLDAWDLCQQAMWHLHQRTEDDVALAEPLFEKAVALDPAFARAYAGHAWLLHSTIVYGWRTDPRRQLRNALDLANQAVRQDGRDALTHFALGRILALSGDITGAIREHRLSIQLNPNFAFAAWGLGEAYVRAGQYDEAAEQVETALRLSPRDPMGFLFEVFRGLCLDALGEISAAESAYREAVSANHNVRIYWPHILLADYYVRQGRLDEARAVVADVLKRQPDLTLRVVNSGAEFALFIGKLGDWLANLRKAGLPA